MNVIDAIFLNKCRTCQVPIIDLQNIKPPGVYALKIQMFNKFILKFIINLKFEYNISSDSLVREYFSQKKGTDKTRSKPQRHFN